MLQIKNTYFPINKPYSCHYNNLFYMIYSFILNI